MNYGIGKTSRRRHVDWLESLCTLINALYTIWLPMTSHSYNIEAIWDCHMILSVIYPVMSQLSVTCIIDIYLIFVICWSDSIWLFVIRVSLKPGWLQWYIYNNTIQYVWPERFQNETIMVCNLYGTTLSGVCWWFIQYHHYSQVYKQPWNEAK